MNIAAQTIPSVPSAQDVPLVIDTDLLRRYGGNGPRYTSYPTADRFVEAFAGVLQSYIAVSGERVTHRQPIAWLRTV